jgi:hypothetical protein
MKEDKPKLQPFPLSGLGRLHVDDKQSVGVIYRLIALFPNCIGGGFVSSAGAKPLHLTEHGRHRLQVGANRSLEVIIGRPNEPHVPVISLGIVEAENK